MIPPKMAIPLLHPLFAFSRPLTEPVNGRVRWEGLAFPVCTAYIFRKAQVKGEGSGFEEGTRGVFHILTLSATLRR